MPPKKTRTYGSKRSVITAGSSAIFGGNAESLVLDSVDDLTEALAETGLGETAANDFDSSSTEAESSISEASASELAVPGLELLIEAHKADTGHGISVLPWTSVLPCGSSITKIAEASFAEVYRVTTKAGSSIIKIMQLKVPSDIASYELETAAEVEHVISEIRIMNALTTVPGYVTFKGTYIVQGPPPKAIADAHEAHLPKLEEGSWFPHPATGFNENSTFLVLELGDAGDVLERVPLDQLHKVWDLFLGVVMALARAEITNEFEHRDLHENNICVRLTEVAPHVSSSKNSMLFGRSGLEVTLIDYGLSRTRLESGEIIYKDLETDPDLFQATETGVAGVQFDTYRRMRTHMITGTHSMQPKAWHKANGSSISSVIASPWKDHMPYTNVLWIRYILHYLLKTYQDRPGGLTSSARREFNLFVTAIKELQKRLNTKTKIENGAFTSAQDVLAFALQERWVTEQQLEQYGVDESSLGEISSLIEDSDVTEEDD